MVALAEVVAAAELVVAELAPESLVASDAVSLVRAFARLERIAAAGKAVCARRVAESKVWSRAGDRSPAHWLGRVSGSSISDAVGLLDSVAKLDRLPAAGEAFRRGDLSAGQVKAVAEAASASPGHEDELLAAAAKLLLQELRERSRQVRHAAEGVDGEARHRRIRRERYLRTWTDSDGAGCGSWRTTVDQQAVILDALRAHEKHVFDKARSAGVRERGEAYAVDALVRMAAGTGSAPRKPGSNAKVIVRVDHAALMRGAVGSGEVCEIAGIGPVPVSVVREWVAGDAFVAALVTDGVDVRSVVHLGRKATALQRTALEWIAPTCCVEGCSTSIRLEIDHEADWAKTKQTVLGSLDRLCTHHHMLKSRHGYRLAPGAGKRPLLPPERGSPKRSRPGPEPRNSG